jgi:hypothetical protein
MFSFMLGITIEVTHTNARRHDVIKRATKEWYLVSDGRVLMLNMLFHIKDERKVEKHPRHLLFFISLLLLRILTYSHPKVFIFHILNSDMPLYRAIQRLPNQMEVYQKKKDYAVRKEQ